jgi:hypothetical protein
MLYDRREIAASERTLAKREAGLASYGWEGGLGN